MIEILKDPGVLGICWMIVVGLIAIAWIMLLREKKILSYRGYSISAGIALLAAVVIAGIQHRPGLLWLPIILSLLNLLLMVVFWRGVPEIEEPEDEFLVE
jgi:hypothetical protein